MLRSVNHAARANRFRSNGRVVRAESFIGRCSSVIRGKNRFTSAEYPCTLPPQSLTRPSARPMISID